MGIDVTVYLMNCAKVNPDSVDYDFMETVKDFDWLYDGMCGDYLYVGKKLVAMDMDHFSHQEIVINNILEIDTETYLKIKEHFPYLTKSEFKLRLIQHLW